MPSYPDGVDADVITEYINTSPDISYNNLKRASVSSTLGRLFEAGYLDRTSDPSYPRKMRYTSRKTKSIHARTRPKRSKRKNTVKESASITIDGIEQLIREHQQYKETLKVIFLELKELDIFEE